MFEALLDAKHEQRQILVTWLDLCNAYGSVKHNLVQFALHWYHVPESLCTLVLNYYDKIHASIQTSNGPQPPSSLTSVFQGCVLSCILVFQLLLDILTPLAKNGYRFKDSSIVLHDQAFADDLSITLSSPKANQDTLDAVVRFLICVHFKAKAPKCVCLGMKKFDPKFEPIYAPYDPDLKIDGAKIRFIVNAAADPSSLQYDHFKELGRLISVDLSEDKVREKFENASWMTWKLSKPPESMAYANSSCTSTLLSEGSRGSSLS